VSLVERKVKVRYPSSGGHRQLGHIPSDRILRGFVQPAWCRSDRSHRTDDAAGPAALIRDGDQGVDVRQPNIVPVFLHEPGQKDEGQERDKRGAEAEAQRR